MDRFLNLFKVKADEEEEEAPPAEEAEEEEEEAELVDPGLIMKENCLASDSHCQHLFAVLGDCETRVRSKKSTEETCKEELIDYKHAVDHCYAAKLFSQLK